MGSDLGRLARTQLDDAGYAEVVGAARAEHVAHVRAGGVEFETAIWIVTARR